MIVNSSRIRWTRVTTAVIASVISVMVFVVALRPVDAISNRALGEIQEYADLHEGSLRNIRSAENYLSECVVRISGTSMAPQVLLKTSESDLMKDHAAYRAMIDLLSDQSFRNLELEALTSTVSVGNTTVLMKTRCLYDDLSG